jgi:hypothetical protein
VNGSLEAVRQEKLGTLLQETPAVRADWAGTAKGQVSRRWLKPRRRARMERPLLGLAAFAVGGFPVAGEEVRLLLDSMSGLPSSSPGGGGGRCVQAAPGEPAEHEAG